MASIEASNLVSQMTTLAAAVDADKDKEKAAKERFAQRAPELRLAHNSGAWMSLKKTDRKAEGIRRGVKRNEFELLGSRTLALDFPPPQAAHDVRRPPAETPVPYGSECEVFCTPTP